ncbi:fimbrial protein [Lelliottia sp. CFBP8978]|uniref:fimbrial protein n=1 Tax=Lelliottia sp. CFBP8978 TaxID=3096522 RepID=UPI002A6B265A|nr:fimbrial protein [Lelliottia sp. CFBP8978]MDY1035418.1 fimbrial protein [Lelliottia sp. CFBP8978]
MRIFSTVTLFFATACVAIPSWVSACDLQNQSTLSISLDGSLQKDPLQANVGDTLYVKRSSLTKLAHRKQDIVCTPVQSQDQLVIKGNMTGSMTGDHVYPTTVPGIGIRLSVVIGKKGNHTSLMSLPFTQQYGLKEISELTSDNVFIKTELVKTGAISTSGRISYQNPSLFSFTHSITQQVVNVDYTLAVTPPAGYCHFTTTNAAFTLATVSSSAVKSASQMPATPMPITFACMGSATHIEMTLYGAMDKAGNGVLRNKDGVDQATGVGVQLLYQNNPVVFGSPISLDGLPLINNQGEIPLSARYFPTAPQVTSGKVDTLATIKLNFL